MSRLMKWALIVVLTAIYTPFMLVVIAGDWADFLLDRMGDLETRFLGPGWWE